MVAAAHLVRHAEDEVVLGLRLAQPTLGALKKRVDVVESDNSQWHSSLAPISPLTSHRSLQGLQVRNELRPHVSIAYPLELHRCPGSECLGILEKRVEAGFGPHTPNGAQRR